MSRIGKMPIKIENGASVTVVNGGEFGHQLVTVTGPNGTLTRSIRHGVKVAVEGDQIIVTRDNDLKQNKAYHGLYRSLIANMVTGVTTGFKKELEIIGIGYRADNQGDKIVFSLGYAHKIEYVPPVGVTVTVTDQTQITVSGADFQQVGESAAKIRSFREPEPYQGKGIKYKTEQIRRKSVKKGA